MAILNLTSSLRLGKGAALVLASVLATGCAIFSVFGGKPYAFDHKVHMKEGLECSACHTGAADSDAPGMPILAGCKLCHDALDAEKAPERHVEALFAGDTFKARNVSKLGGDVRFSHKQHVGKAIECASCHVGIAENERVDASLALRMNDCTTCHGKQKVANECATCHEHIRVDAPPPSHHLQWDKLHGPTVRSQSTATANNCAMCHTESTCSSCHESQPPENHSEYFRHRGHGLFAKMDRQNCAACHRSDSCDACHKETTPMSHTGSFGGTTSNHCVGCHLPLQTNECYTCHKSTPSHETATPLPAGHTAGMDCRMCHGNGQPLPHADKGDACSACHH